MEYKPTVVFDFDGVIHSYQSGWQGADIVTDPVVPGIREVIEQLRERGYKVVVVSTRCVSLNGMGAVRQYLRQHDIIVDDVMAEKPPAICYVDDRAICFKGETDTLVDQIVNFRTWTEAPFRRASPVSGLRKCSAKYWEDRTIHCITGWFHQWASDYEEFETGPGNFTTALVEDENGVVRHCLADGLVFLDR